MPNLMTDLCLDISHSCVEAEESNLPRRCPVELDLLPLKQPQVQSLQFPWLKQLYTNSIAECCDKASSVIGIDVNQIPASTESDDPNTHSSPSSSHSPFLLEGIQSKRELSEKMQELDDRICEMNSRGASDEEEGSCNPRKKLRLSKEQSALLEESFKEQSTLNPKQKQALAKQLSLRPRQVEVWFQNRRARTKLKQTELDCELLKHCCESLSEENRRLQRELQELRAMKLTPPHVGAAQNFFMPLPATSLTICPSCERLATLHNQPSSRVTKYTQSSAA